MANSVLEMGGILPKSEGCPERASELAAVTFNHFGRPIVRLVASELAVAEELAVSSLGLERESTEVVGASVQRAVGFPAWPIIHDPENARHALNLVGDLNWARRHARNRAKNVKERFDALTATLTASAPHFVPTLLEELSRVFVSVENEQYARQYFTKARDIERAYAIPIDAERHRAVFLEFAIAGVVAARELTNETKAALERFADPKEAFEYLLDINTERVRAGVEPYAYMVRDLRRAGKAAGFKPAEVDDRIIDAVLDLKATVNAPDRFWEDIEPSLVRYAKQHAQARKKLLHIYPRSYSMAAWIDFLKESGCIPELREDRQRHAAWLMRLIKWHGGALAEEDGRLVAEAEFAAEYLKSRVLKVSLNRTPLSLLDALAERGVEFDLSGVTAGYWRDTPDWSKWLGADFENHRRSLKFVAKHPALREHLVDAIKPNDLDAYLDVFLAHEGAVELLAAKVDALVAQRASTCGSIPNNKDYLDVVRHFARPELAERIGKPVEQLFAFDAALEFQTAIRRGTFAEYTWPAYEQSVERLCKLSGKQDYLVFETYPAVAVVSGEHLEIIDGDEVIFTAELPAKYSRISAVRLVEDDAVIVYEPQNTWYDHVLWLRGGATAKVGYIYGGRQGYSLPVAGGRLTAHGLLAPGEVSFGSDGGTVMAVAPTGVPAYTSRYARQSPDELWDGSRTHSIDRDTEDYLATLGIKDLFKIPENATVALGFSVIIPAQPTTLDSPLGVERGAHICLQVVVDKERWLLSSHGTYKIAGLFSAVLRRPGGGFWFAEGGNIFDQETELPIESAYQSTTRCASVESLPEEGWHQLRPRNEQASARMRKYTLKQARAVMQAAQVMEPATDAASKAVDHPFKKAVQVLASAVRELQHVLEDSDAAAPEITRVLGAQLGTTDPSFIGPVADIAAKVASQAGSFAELRDALHVPLEQRQADGEQAQAPITEAGFQVLDNFIERGDRQDVESIAYVFHHIRAFQQGIQGVKLQSDRWFSVRWLDLAGNERYLLAAAGSPQLAEVYGEQPVRDFIAFLRAGVQAGIFGHGWHKVDLILPRDADNAFPFAAFTPIEDYFFLSSGNEWRNNASVKVVELWVPNDGRTEISGYPIESTVESFPLDAAAFLAGLDAVEAQLAGRKLSAEALETLTAGTYLTADAASYLFGGMFGRYAWQSRFLSKEQRAALGISVVGEKSARLQVRAFRKHTKALLASAVPLENPSAYVTAGPDVQAVAKYWAANIGTSTVRLSDAEATQVCSAGEVNLPHIFDLDLAELESRNNDFAAAKLIAPLLNIAASRPLNDPSRPILAEHLRALRAWVQQQFRAPKEKLWTRLAAVDFGTEYAKLPMNSSFSVLKLLSEGHLDALIADLAHVYDVGGDPHDPAVAAPEVLAEMSSELGISTDAARYYSQLLALMQPTDANIRSWNGWRKKDIDQAAAELVQRGLLLEATRSGAGRSYFLPGGWLSGSTGNKPVEVWKAPHYMLWQDSVVRPVLDGGLPLVPFKQLFEEVWERYAGGDTPGYEELKTTRYRSRRR
ncbi:hypothetical protein FRX94_01555 [Corynebacterium canis]|uniref:DNA-binding protein n=1 Tax=Corynebacterium canis TaxID=679663 RepID=A0A5C5UQY7_9CORY|nr:hypothetical protein [Corynebacterium canis]TWT28901.1 hypothetical protein FRX94_01555 [Corynebacterium canis]WJY75040.1 hypothetical protein CCANI_05970 [Corynebacterium canis]